MSEHLHDDAGVNALRDQQRRTRVPQVVESLSGKTGTRQDAVEIADEIAGVDRRPNGGGEDKRVVLPSVTGEEPLL